MHVHFLAGLPRSGTTLMASLLSQHPQVTSNLMSPIGYVFNDLHRALSNVNEASMYISDEQRADMLRGLFYSYYGDAEVAVDNNRRWPPKLPVLSNIFPLCRMVCCVRSIPSIVNSVEKLIRANPLKLSTIFGCKPNTTVYSRTQQLMSPEGLVGFALEAVRDAYFGPHRNRMFVVDYDAFVRDPAATMAFVSSFLGLSEFDYNFGQVQQLPRAAEFDELLGTPGLHTLHPKVTVQEDTSLLPPDIVASLPPPFWR